MNVRPEPRPIGSTMLHPEEIPFAPDWPEPAARFLRAELPPAPELPLRDVLGPRLD